MPLMLSRKIFILIATFLFTTLAPVSDVARAVPKAQPQIKCIALLIACGQFDKPDLKIDKLEGVKNDLHMMRDILKLKYGFLDIRELTSWDKAQDKRATRANIIKEIQKLIKDMDANTYAVIYFTGHGGQTKDKLRQNSTNSEYLITQDCQPIFDFEIDHYTSKLDGHLTLIFDCCHAGGAARGPGEQTNVFGIEKSGSLPPAVLDVVLKSTLPRKDEFISSTDPHRVLLAATSKSDTTIQISVPAPDQQKDDEYSGIFTYTLYNTIIHSSQPFTNGGILLRTAKMMGDILREQDKTKLTVVYGNISALAIAPTFRASIATLGGRTLPVGWMGKPGKAIMHSSGKAVSITPINPFESRLSVSVPDLNLDPHVATTIVPLNNILPKGDDPNGDTVDGVQIVIIHDKQTGDYSIEGKTATGRYKLGTTHTKEEAVRQVRDQKESLVIASRIVQSLNGADSPFIQSFELKMGIVNSGDIAQPVRLSPRKPGYPILREGDKFKLQIQSLHPGNLLLLSCEPDGSVNILYPNQETETPRLNGLQELNELIATRPPGLTTLIAIETTNQIALPQNLVKATQLPMTHYTIARSKVDDFIKWIQNTISTRKELLPQPLADEVARGTGVLAGARIITLNTVQVHQYSFVTEAGNPSPELISASQPKISDAQRRVLEAHPIQLRVRVRPNGDHKMALEQGTGDREIDEAIQESFNYWIWRPGVKITRGYPEKIETTVKAKYDYRDGTYTIQLIESD